MIRPGLARVSALLKNTPLPWKAVHVAGTNGKGSICAATAALLQEGGLSTGRFTSPHLVDPWDCITINGKPIAESIFKRLQDETIEDAPTDPENHPTPFEILTATAFKAFTKEKVEVAVVETGMGGREDATNVLASPLVTVISKIGMDHQKYLGNTLEEIASHKAGIIKAGAACVIDGTNHTSVTKMLLDAANKAKAGTVYFRKGYRSEKPSIWDTLDEKDFEPHDKANISCAVKAAAIVLKKLKGKEYMKILLPAIKENRLPGRLQNLQLDFLRTRYNPVLLDGAHNPQSAVVLSAYIERKLRNYQKYGQNAISWVIALSEGKDAARMLKMLIQPVDRVIVTEFGPVEGMPWVRPMLSERLAAVLCKACPGCKVVIAKSVEDAVVIASRRALERPIVITGSLYLVSEVLRLNRDANSRYKRINTVKIPTLR